MERVASPSAIWFRSASKAFCVSESSIFRESGEAAAVPGCHTSHVPSARRTTPDFVTKTNPSGGGVAPSSTTHTLPISASAAAANAASTCTASMSRSPFGFVSEEDADAFPSRQTMRALPAFPFTSASIAAVAAAASFTTTASSQLRSDASSAIR